MDSTSQYHRYAKGIVITVFLIAILLGALVAATKQPQEQSGFSATNYTVIPFGEREIRAEVVATSETRMRGLSGRLGLFEGTGMLFIFDAPEHHGFWMKEMRFPIDILWLSPEKRIVYIEERLSPDTYPTIFRPKEKVLYVLEVPAGETERAGVKVGDTLKF